MDQSERRLSARTLPHVNRKWKYQKRQKLPTIQGTEAVAAQDRGGEITCPRYVISQGERHEASFT